VTPVWVLSTDGAARGNPGPAGAGATLHDPEGRPVDELGVPLGRLTNNEAEYRALLLGLQMALRNEVRRLRVRMDSELVVRQLSGRYKVKTEHLRPLFEEARSLIGRFEHCEVVHVRRGENADADRLANAGIDSAGAGGGH
jgi:ribonuclease HI